MHINKRIYYIWKIVEVVGMYLWGFLSVIMGLCIAFSVIISDYQFMNNDVLSITAVIFSCWIAHFFLRDCLEKTKLYNGFFSNDPDGILQMKVIARALGIEEEQVIKHINILLRMKLIKNCSIVCRNGQNLILLSNVDKTETKEQYRDVICPHCGGHNQIRAGYVQSCQFCSGKLE